MINEYDALVDLAFNVGATALNEKNSPDLNDAIKAGDYDAIADNLRYSLANGQRSQGLVNRSDSRKDIYKYGIYGRRY